MIPIIETFNSKLQPVRIIILFSSVLIFLISCSSSIQLSDPKGTKDAESLIKRINKLSQQGIMVGHQDDLAYGVGWWAEKDHSDMFLTSGEYPAVFGWDLGNIHEEKNLDKVDFENMISWIKQIHLNGGIITISWHMDNPISGNNSWDKVKIAKDILPGGEHHKDLLHRLDLAAEFFNKCKVGESYIPIIFRPFHEHNGDWFWWGKGNVTEEEYIALYRFIVNYYRNEKNIHHLIYAFSPDRSRISDPTSRAEYLWGYPGDGYIDLLGIDNYKDMPTTGIDSLDQLSKNNMVAALEMVTDLAKDKGKLSALTETGFEGIKDPNWFSQKLFNPILNSKKARRISYILLWRNYDTKHHYMVYPGHQAAEDFIQCIRKSDVLTLSDIGTGKISN